MRVLRLTMAAAALGAAAVLAFAAPAPPDQTAAWDTHGDRGGAAWSPALSAG